MNKKRSTRNEVEELEQAYTGLTGRRVPQKRKKKKKDSIKAALICAFSVLLLLVCAVTFYNIRYGTLFDRFLTMDDVTIGGISMDGMTKDQARSALEKLARDTYSQPMVIQVLDTTVTLTPEDAGIDPDMEAALEDAYRTDAAGSFDLLPYLNLDLNAVRTAVDSLGTQYNTELSQSQSAITGQTPSLEPGAEDGGQGLTLTVTLGSPEYGLDTEALYEQVVSAYNSGQLLVTGTCSEVQPRLPDLDALYAQSYIAPVDAVMDPQTFEITPEIYGYHFDLDTAKAQLAQAAYGQTLEFSFEKIQPEVTAEALGSTLFCDVLGSAKTPYKGSDTNNRNTNLALACEAINGLVLLPGESFEYNETLGERTPEAGYKPAPSYVGGLTMDTYGGGICQVSSTLYYSTLFADLEILERYNHGYISDYIDPGMDATVTWGGADFRFRNNTNYPIRIEAWRADGYVNVQIIGTDERSYYVEMTYDIISSESYETVYQEYPPDNEEGYKDGQEIVTPYKGYKVKAYKEKYDKETGELISSELESTNTYKKRDRVICKIVEPTETTTASTE